MKPTRSLLALTIVALAACDGPELGPAVPGGGSAPQPLVAAAAREFPDRIPLPGVVPEGVTIDRRGTVYVSVRRGARGEIWQYSPAGEATFVADLGTATATGLDVTADGTLYAAMAEGPDRGVYRLERGAQPERLPGTENLVYANAFALDPRGTLYVTESYSGSRGAYGQGGIWRIPRHGAAELWLRHPLLTGIGAVLGYPVGANGIVFYQGDLFVVNTDRSTIVRVPVRMDGTAGEPEVWVTLQEVPGSPMAGSPFPVMGDGLALDVHGNLYVALVSRNAVVRINREDRSQQTVARLGAPAGGDVPSALFDTPVSLAFGTGGGAQQQLFVTNLGWMRLFVPGPTWPGPGLVKVDAGMPGRPLP